MKNIYILLVSSLVLLASCSDFLESDSSSSLTDTEAITTLDELQLAVNGVYFVHGGQRFTEKDGLFGTYSSEFPLYADMLGGDFEPKTATNQLGPIGRYNVDAAHSLTDFFYYKFYKTLARINVILKVIDDVEYDHDSEEEVAQYNDLKGQLYAMRGLQHFDLARLYCRLPSTVADMNAPSSGVVLSDKVFDYTYKGVRSTLSETYGQVLNDLTTSLPLLSKDKNLGRINYWAAKGIEARAYLYLEQNDKALAAAQEVMKSDKYSLYAASKYSEVWLEQGSSESLFEILVTAKDNAQRNSLGYYTHNDNGYGECGLTAGFKSFLDARSTDVRSKMIVKEKDNNFYPTKYNGRDNNVYLNNAKIIRLSEVYLIAAEAAVKINTAASKAEAVKLMNTLRKNRITDYEDVAVISLNDVLTERRIELFCEGHNAWDYWRNKQSVVNTTVHEVKYDDKRTILPLPAREISMNPGLVQNPR